MKKRLLTSMLGVVLAINMAGCGVQETEDFYSVPSESIEPVQAEQNVTESNISEADKTESGTLEQEVSDTDNAIQNAEEPQKNTEEQTEKELTFADLSKFRFELSSGAGAWSEEFTIEKDGYFTGSFHDADMGDTGEGYENGTYHVSSYSGHFDDLTKVDDYTYEITLEDITYADTPGTVENWDNQRTFYTDSWALMNADTLTIYLPGTSLEKLSEDVLSWISMVNESDTELTMMVMENKVYGHGIYSYNRLPALEDAQMTYNTYKESYDYYGEKLSQAGTTVEMVECTATMYEYSDGCLNYIWNLIRYNVEESEYQNILAEQREWIKEKEEKAQEAAAEYEGGSIAGVVYNDTLAKMTIERCEELIEYLK